jgi:hypothetical protein
MRKLVIPLMVLVVLMFIPYDAFAQTPESIFPQLEILPDGIILENGVPIPVTEYVKVVKLTENSNSYDITMLDNSISIDKTSGAISIFDELGIMKTASDSFVVRGAELNTDNWNDLSINDVTPTITITEDYDTTTVNVIRENADGIFRVETVVSPIQLKTTAYFTNNNPEFINHKFAFTETLNLTEYILQINSQIINLLLYEGQSFNREVLEQNEDLVLEVGQMGYHSGIGFDQLWQVNIGEDLKVSLDYANVGETHTPIGDTVELDPTWDMTIGITMNGAMNNGQFANAGKSAFDSSGNMWVGDSSNHRVQKFDSSGNYLTQIGTTGVSGQGNYEFYNSGTVAIDSNDNLYVGDNSNQRVQKYDSSGTYLSTIGTTGVSGTGNYLFMGITSVTVDSSDNLYVVDGSNQRVAKYNSSGTFLLNYGVAGTATSANYINGGGSLLYYPQDVAVQSNGDVLIANQGTHVIKKYNSNGSYLGTIGSGVGTGYNQFYHPTGISVDSNDNFYVADMSNNRIQKYNSGGGFLQTIGTSTMGNPGSGIYQFKSPQKIGIDSNDNFYVADSNYHVKKFSSWGSYLSTIGVTTNGASNPGQFDKPYGMAFDSLGNMWIADSENARVQKLDSSGNYLSQIGTTGVPGQLMKPRDVVIDSNDNVWVSDDQQFASNVKKYDSSGNLLLQIGTTGTGGTANGQFKYPRALAVDSNDNLYVVDSHNFRVQIFDSSGNYISQIGTTGVSGTGNYLFGSYSMAGIAIDSSDNIFVADTKNNRIQKYDSSRSYLSTIGTTGVSGTGDYEFNDPQGISIDPSGNLFVMDAYNHRVQQFDSSGTYLLTIGTTGVTGTSNNQFYYASSVETDAIGSLYVSDSNNKRVQKYTFTTPPSSPTNLIATQTVANQITLNWTAPSSGSAPSSYEVYLNGVLIDTIGNVTTYTDNITGAEIGVGLTYMVEAINSAGSATSNNATITSWDVPDVVTGVQALAGIPISLSWVTPSSDDTVTGFNVYRDGPLLTTLGNVNSYLDNAITPGQSYSYEISAISAVGEGAKSTPLSTIAGAVPVAPTNLAATTSDPIILTWTASPDPIAASPVLHYSMERSTDGTNWSTLSANMGNVVTYTDNTTTAGTIYHYKVAANTNAGVGPASTPTSASAGTVSSAPQTLAVTQTIPAQLDTTWAAPADDGSTGGITGYKVYRDGAVKATLGNVLSYNDATIAAGTQYTYTVTALNAAGESAVSNGIVITSWAVPDAPTGVTASGGIPIVVSWNAPNSDRPITDYKVYRDGSLLTTVSAPTLTYSDSNVIPNTTYAYTISAVSAVGEGAQSGSTNGQSGVPPAQITTFTATPVDSSRIKLDWAAPNDNGYPITSYKIYQGGNHVGTTAGLTYTDTGLQNNTIYSYTVTAVNIGGEGTQSAAQTATTATPLTPPTNVYTEEHVTSVNVTWDKVIGAINYTVERDGVTLGTTTNFWFIDNTVSASTSYVYKIYANSSAINGLNGTPSTVTTASATIHQYITVTPTAPSANAYPIDMYELHRNGAMVGYLEPNNLVYEDHDVTIGTTYTYQVRAHNLLGWSQLSPVGSVTTWNVPDIITTLAGNTGSPIILTWTAPNTDKPITLYTIYRDGNLLATTTNLTYSDATVAAGTIYVYTATATSIIGEGIQSAGLSLQAGTVPTVPQNAVATAQAGNNISFSWTAPSNNGGVPVTGYNPQVSTDNGTTWTDLLTVPTTATSFSHTGLTTGQNYSYQVLAINTVGNSPYTAVVSTIAGDVPAQVTGLGTTAISDTAIDLTWNVPANNAYSISSYNVLKSVDGTTWTTLTSVTNSYSDTGLTADTIYHYKISAINTLGTGAESATAQQRTFGLPDSIATITLTPQSTTQINLSWTQPNLNGFPLVAYTVQQSTDSGATWTTLATQTSTTYSAIALTQNTIYDYRVNTENSFGNTNGTINTATTYPIATNVISGTTQSDTEIQVTWNAIAGNGVVQYSLEKSTDSGVTWTPATLYLTSTTYTDTGLTPLTDYNYRVASVNSAGLSSPSISSNTVTTFGPSDVPTNLTLTALINAEIQLDWVAPTITNGAPVTSYNIERSTNGSTWSVLVNNVVGLTHTDTGLTTSQVYHYKVSANNIYGTSAFSSSANAMASDVPSQVTGLTATTLPNYEIQLDWVTPNSNGYNISGYTIERSTDGGTTWNILIADTQNTNIIYTDINLTVSQVYHYRVSAINQVGTGVVSTAANATAGDVPSANVLTATPIAPGQIDLSWTVPNSNGFTLTKYTVNRSLDGITWTVIASVIPSVSTTHSDTGLTIGTLYYYNIATENAVGFSVASNVESLNAGDVPGITANLTGTTQSDTQILLNWTSSTPNGYPITGYKIEQSINNSVWTVLVADTQSTQTSYTSSSLTPATDYYYRVLGINQLGTSAISNTVLVHTFGPPEPVTSVTPVATSTSITLNWVAPYDHGSTITGYKIEVKDFVTGNWLNLTTVQTTTYTQINMIPNTLYEYQITAINQYGTSVSQTIPVSTLATAPATPTVTTISGTELKVEWPVVSGTGITYTIYTSSDDITYTAGPVGHPTAYFDHQGLTNGQTVYYKITILNSSGESPQSSSASATTWTVPDAPTNLQVTHPTPLSATLTWTAPVNDGGDTANLSYTVQRSNDNFSWASYYPTVNTTYTDTSLVIDTQYYWRINSVNSVGIGGNSASVSYLTPGLPTAPSNLTAILIGSNNNSAELNWSTPNSNGGKTIIGYNIQRSLNGGSTWSTLVSDTGSTITVYTNTGLTLGQQYTYQVAAITVVGTGSYSNSASVQPSLITVIIAGTPQGGNSVVVTPTVSLTGPANINFVKVSLYKNHALTDSYLKTGAVASGVLTALTSYPTVTSDFYVIVKFDTGYAVQSNTISLTPAAPFSGEITFNEDRLEYTSTTCVPAGGAWNGFTCDLDFTISDLEFTVQPVGADVIIKYQPQNLNAPPIVKAFTSTSAAINELTQVSSEIDYYGSIYVNPPFNYNINTDGTIQIICDPTDILCDDSDIDPTVAGIQSNVPLGTPSEKTFKSFKDPNATRQLGIEPMGNLFGVNMVFIFVIAMAGIFTGRSAPMGVIFIIVTLGIMAYLGYLDFGSDALNAATWGLLIISAILGLFLGKRWS